MTLSEIKFRMYNRSPFFGTIIFNLPVEEDKTIPTLGVDGEKLYFNPTFWNKLTNKQKLGVFAHELAHLFLDHISRRKGRDDIAIDPTTGQTVSLWNLACDFAVNIIVVDSFKGREFLPRQVLYDTKYVGWSSEKIYEDLKKKIPEMSAEELKGMIEGSFSDKSKWGKLKGKKAEEARGKMKQIFQQAMEEAKSKGDVPAGLERWFKEMEPKEDWRKVLLEYVQPFVNDYNFARPDRRYLESDFYLPDIKDGEKLDWLAIAVDTSGSIGTKELDHFVSEIKGILGSFEKVRVKLTFCDAEATPFTELEEYEPSKIKPNGGGGTDFRPVFELIRKEETRPEVLIYFTDMLGDFPKSSPGFDTVWVSTSGKDYKPPFGKLLPYHA